MEVTDSILYNIDEYKCNLYDTPDFKIIEEYNSADPIKRFYLNIDKNLYIDNLAILSDGEISRSYTGYAVTQIYNYKVITKLEIPKNALVSYTGIILRSSYAKVIDMFIPKMGQCEKCAKCYTFLYSSDKKFYCTLHNNILKSCFSPLIRVEKSFSLFPLGTEKMYNLGDYIYPEQKFDITNKVGIYHFIDPVHLLSHVNIHTDILTYRNVLTDERLHSLFVF